jgi:hypothetical protein
MSRIVLICALAALLAACGIKSANHLDLARERLACGDVGIAPGDAAFNQCVVNLDQSLSAASAPCVNPDVDYCPATWPPSDTGRN